MADAGMVPGMFAGIVIDWQRRHGRHDLPWQLTRDPYAVWLSEIMLQQTQVGTVIPYYLRFLERFADVAALAAAPLDDVLALWSGLGYYSRARNLHRCAQLVVSQFDGRFPASAEQLQTLPGIGRSTAAAIASFCFGERAAILDGNVKRVLCRVFGVEGYPGERAIDQQLWLLAQQQLPPAGIDAYTQGLMDLGATLCTRARPRCTECPLAGKCRALALDAVARLPARKPRKVSPWRGLLLLVLVDGERVLLEKRPPSGIWGGLWSLPELPAQADELPDGEAAAARIARALTGAGAIGLPVMSAQSLPVIEHAFTHYKLRAWPLRLQLAPQPPGAPALLAAQSDRVWMTWQQVADAGLPTPVKALLMRIGGAGAPASLSQGGDQPGR